MVHICFDMSGYCSIKYAMKNGVIKEDNIVAFWDDLSVGNISNCRDLSIRKDIIKRISCEEIENNNDYEIEKEFSEFYKILDNENEFVIWYVRNPKEICNLYYLISLIGNKDVYLVRCLKKKQKDRTFYYDSIGQILTRDIPKLLESKVKLTEKYKKECLKNWQELVLENGQLRIKKKKRIRTDKENYYDSLILNKISDKYNKIACIVGDFIGRDAPYLKSWFVTWRIDELHKAGAVDIYKRGDLYMFNDVKLVNNSFN